MPPWKRCNILVAPTGARRPYAELAMMINSNPSSSQPPAKAAQRPQGDQTPPPDPEDRFDLSGIPTAVKLYDMSPIWGPKPQEWTLPRGVRGLC